MSHECTHLNFVSDSPAFTHLRFMSHECTHLNFVSDSPAFTHLNFVSDSPVFTLLISARPFFLGIVISAIVGVLEIAQKKFQVVPTRNLSKYKRRLLFAFDPSD